MRFRCDNINNVIFNYFRFSPADQSQAVDRINHMYGAFDNKVNRVIYVSGTVDPWQSLFIRDVANKRNNSYKVIIIEGKEMNV